MPRTEHLVLCGGTHGQRHADTKSLRLNLHGPSENVHLKISDLSERLVANIPNVLIDLLEVASYIYAADSAISRGGPTDERLGKRWRRKFRFVIPVREPDIWSSDSVLSSLAETLNFLSDDDYVLEFRSFNDPPALKSYFEFSDTEASGFRPDEVMLFSGGLDSLAGAIDQLTIPGNNVALVSHRSSSKISAAQEFLVGKLRSRFGANRVLNVPIRANLKSDVSNEPTHRTRSFLFAALGTATARCFGKNRILLFENGMMSFNLPPVAQVVGARASRTTSPASSGRLLPRSYRPDRPYFQCGQSIYLADKIRCHRKNCNERRERIDSPHPELHPGPRDDEAPFSLREMLAVHRSSLCNTSGRPRGPRSARSPTTRTYLKVHVLPGRTGK